MSGYQAVLDAMPDGGSTSWNGVTMYPCPAHDDDKPSLAVKEGDDGKALVYCHAGCDTYDVVKAIGLEMKDLGGSSTSKGAAIADTYEYQDEEGNLLYRVVRLSPKGFYQERYEDGKWTKGLNDTRRVLYHLPELVARGGNGTVYVCEGEKDVEALRRLGHFATCTLGGASKWRDEYAAFLTGYDVVLVGDNDDPGRASVALLRDKLSGVAKSVTSVYPAVGKDISNHLDAGLSIDALVTENEGLDEFGPLDWETYEAVEVEWLVEPYIPKGGRTLAFGSAGSLKSLWAMWVSARLAREGKKVAYFALEMLHGDIASRMKQLNPPKQNMLIFTRDLKLGSPSHTEKIVAGLKGFDLIVIDSWSAARAHAGRESNEAVAELDAEVLMPILRTTGASILLIDNVGHDFVTDSGKIKADHARGASAKGDKMEVTLWFHRPFEDNNYRTQVGWKKMRLNYPAPSPVTMETPQERIEFYLVNDGVRTETSVWDGGVEVPKSDEPIADTDDMTPLERRKLARLSDMFKVVKPDPEEEEESA